MPAEQAELPDERYPFVMLTGRIRDQWHTMTRSGKSPRLSQTRPEPCVELHPRDAIALDLPNGSLAQVRSARGRMLARVEWSDAIRRGEIFVPMHWTAQLSDSGRVGPLIASAVDPISGQPELKATPVAVEPLPAGWFGFVLSRRAMTFEGCDYRVAARGEGYWRYEIAGTGAARDWFETARREFGRDGDWLEFADSKGGSFRCARLVEGRLDACLFVSPTTRLPDRGWLGRLFAQDELTNGERSGLLAGRPADGETETGPIVCACFAVGRDALIRAIGSGRAMTTRELGALLNAGTNCGSCIPELNGLLAEHGNQAA